MAEKPLAIARKRRRIVYVMNPLREQKPSDDLRDFDKYPKSAKHKSFIIETVVNRSVPLPEGEFTAERFFDGHKRKYPSEKSARQAFDASVNGGGFFGRLRERKTFLFYLVYPDGKRIQLG